MASYRGIEVVCHSVIELLRDNYDPDDFKQPLDFRVLGSSGFDQGLTAGVSLFLYRVTINDADRMPPGRRDENGDRLRNQLPLDIHMLLTAWGKEPSLQQAVTGWMMRTLEDHPSLPAGILNRRTDGIFRTDEAVELTIGELATEDLLHLWELLGSKTYQLSIPYTARNVRIESTEKRLEAALVQDRLHRYEEIVE